MHLVWQRILVCCLIIRWINASGRCHCLISYFLVAFAKLRKATITFVLFSLCPSAWNISAPIGRIFVKFCLSVFRIAVEKIKLLLLTGITATLREDLSTSMIISRSFVLRMRNVPDTFPRENQNMLFMFNNISPKIVPFMR